MDNEIYIITHEKLEKLKAEANKVLDILPDDNKEAYIVILYLKKMMELEFGFKEIAIKAYMKEE
jgi:hypothetical protein